MKIKIIREVYSDKQRKYMCAMKEPGADRPEGLEQSEAEEMCTGPMKEEQIEEVSAMAGGAVQGAPALQGGPWATEEDEVKKFNKKEKKVSKLKGAPIEEMYSTMGLKGHSRGTYQDEFPGFQERSAQQGLKNVPQKRIKIRLRRKKKLNLNENLSTAEALIKFANIGHIKRKRETLWFNILEQYGLEVLARAIADDNTSESRINFITDKLGSSRDISTGVKNLDNDSIRDYYDFIINEYLFWSYYNPHASPARLADRPIKIGSAAKDLVMGHISRYISNPSRNNPATLSRRAIGKDSSSQKIYKDRPTLDNSLYDLPE